MRIVTWNVNSLNARLDYVLDFLRTPREPDVACLQELKLTDEAFPWDEVEAAGYHAEVHGQASWNGVAVLSKEPVEQVQVGLPGGEEAGSRLVAAKRGDTLVASVYVPNGKTVRHPDFQMKLHWLDAFCEWVEAVAPTQESMVIGGDFNLCPADIDSYDPAGFAGEIFHTDEERAIYDRIVKAGLVDVWRSVEPEAPGFTWWDYRAGHFHKGEGLRIDLLFATPSVAREAQEVKVDRDFRKKREGITPSDHAPLVVDLAGSL